MSLVLFTTPGCLRCAVLKRFIDEHGVRCDEKDVKEAGKADFVSFYAQHRNAIHRGSEGIRFPILVDGAEIRQGLGPALAYLAAGRGLDGFVGADTLAKEWLDGLSVSGGDPGQWEGFRTVLRHLKGCSMKLVLHTDGRQAWILEEIVKQNLADRVVVDVLGPDDVYRALFESERIAEDVHASLNLAARCSGYRFRLVISPIVRDEAGKLQSITLTPEQIGQAAHMIKDATGSNRHPCVVAPAPSSLTHENRSETPPAERSTNLLRCRSEARRFQVFTEIETPR
jgi:pyruvate-formate lyase-activating enzyme/glutaredoxin